MENKPNKEEQEPQKKEIFGNVYETTKSKEGVKLAAPMYSIIFDMDKVNQLEPTKGKSENAKEYLQFSIHRRKDFKERKEANQPTHYLVENQFLKTKKVDIYSTKDIYVSKDDLNKLVLSTEKDGKTFNNAYVTVTQKGFLVPTNSKYKDLKLDINYLSGGSSTINQDATRKIKTSQDIQRWVGNAWKCQSDKGNNFFNLNIDPGFLEDCPTDKMGRVKLALYKLKEKEEVQKEQTESAKKAPDYVISYSTDHINGWPDPNADMELEIKAKVLKDPKIQQDVHYKSGEEEKTCKNINLQAWENGGLSFNLSQYKNETQRKELENYKLTGFNVKFVTPEEKEKRKEQQDELLQLRSEYEKKARLKGYEPNLGSKDNHFRQKTNKRTSQSM